MLFRKRFWPGLADGSITLTFRRWTRPQVVAGRHYQSPAGQLLVTEIGEVEAADISDADAVRAGYPDAETLRADLGRHNPDAPLYRISLRRDGEDPRRALREQEASGAELTDLRKRLDRLDRAAAAGPWTRQTLRLIGERPAVRAPDLASAVGRETLPFKLDVRKLKALGLTESLMVGYRLAPRGRALLDSEGLGAEGSPSAASPAFTGTTDLVEGAVQPSGSDHHE